MRLNKKTAVLSAIGSMISIQSGSSIAKCLFPLMGPAGAVVLRVGIAGILLALAFRPNLFKFSVREWAYILFYGFSIGAMNISFYYGIQRVPLGIGVTIEFIGPLGLALITSRQKTDLLWTFLAALGILMIVPWHTGTVDLIGIAFVATAGLMWALYIVATGKITGKLKNSDSVTCGMCVAALLVLPFGLCSGDLFHLNAKVLWLGLGVAVFSSALPFSLDLLAMKKLPAKTFSVLQSLQPAFGALSGLIFLREYLSVTQWLAVFCVIAASAGATICAQERPDPEGLRPRQSS
ncbi:MAG: DMT family transporter [Thermoguttaceae bacterium]|nr:DMT family transporter [Thermoguttaceae bacterium]